LISVPASVQELRGLAVTRDGVVVAGPSWGVALPADGGEHTVTATAPGYRPYETKVNVLDHGATVSVTVPELTALPAVAAPPTHDVAQEPVAPSEPASKDEPQHGLGTQRTVALVAGGLGLVGVGLGTAFGIASKSKHDEAASLCPQPQCESSAGVSAGQAAHANGNISTVAMIIGGVGLATGVVLWFTAPKAGASEAKTRVGLGLGRIEFNGAF